VNSFDDNYKLNLYTNNNKNQDIWIKNNKSLLLNIKKHSDEDDECLIKRGNSYFYENCNKNLQFICEFNIRSNEIMKKSNNKIKVSCGQSGEGVNTIKTTTTPTVTIITKTSKTIKIIENEVLEELEKQENVGENKNQSHENFKNTDFGKIIFNLYLSFLKFSIFYFIVIIIGAVSGILIVIIILNVFLIWNYYKYVFIKLFFNFISLIFMFF
jgi:hypothetical protein